MNQRPTVTICVTCFNQQDYIADCLDGILAQDLDVPAEILVGDDGSTDGSGDILEEYARRDSRIQLFRRPRNLGFVENQRDLFRRATGEFIAICEADDFWTDRRKLRRQIGIMEERPEVALCVTAASKISEDASRRLGEFRLSKTSRELGVGELIRAMAGVATPSLLIRRSALEQLPEETYDQVVIDYSLQVLVGLHGAVWYDAAETCACRIASRGSWTEGLASSAEKYRQYHEGLRPYQKFLEAQVGSTWIGEIRKVFEPLILGFYMSSRIGPGEKKSNLPHDLPRLSTRGKIIASVLTRAPQLAMAGSLLRRRVWSPVKRAIVAIGNNSRRSSFVSKGGL